MEGGNGNNNNNSCNESFGRNSDLDNDVDDELFHQTNERIITPKHEVKKEKKRIARTDISHSSLPNLNNQSYCFNTFKNTTSKSKSPIKNNDKPTNNIITDIPSLNNPQSKFIIFIYYFSLKIKLFFLKKRNSFINLHFFIFRIFGVRKIPGWP